MRFFLHTISHTEAALRGGNQVRKKCHNLEVVALWLLFLDVVTLRPSRKCLSTSMSWLCYLYFLMSMSWFLCPWILISRFFGLAISISWFFDLKILISWIYVAPRRHLHLKNNSKLWWKRYCVIQIYATTYFLMHGTDLEF